MCQHCTYFYLFISLVHLRQKGKGSRRQKHTLSHSKVFLSLARPPLFREKSIFGKLSAHWVPAADCLHMDSEGAQCISSIIGSGSSGNEEHLWFLITRDVISKFRAEHQLNSESFGGY